MNNLWNYHYFIGLFLIYKKIFETSNKRIFRIQRMCILFCLWGSFNRFFIQISFSTFQDLISDASQMIDSDPGKKTLGKIKIQLWTKIYLLFWSNQQHVVDKMVWLVQTIWTINNVSKKSSIVSLYIFAEHRGYYPWIPGSFKIMFRYLIWISFLRSLT